MCLRYLEKLTIMKTIKNWPFLLFFLAIIVGCKRNEVGSPDISEISFSVGIEEETIVNTKNLVSVITIENLCVLVFNENGNFISRHRAYLNDDKYSIQLPLSDAKRTLHFVANYDWSNFIDQDHLNMHENEFLMSMSTTSKPSYWQRVELHGGIYENCLNFTVSLIRNYAKLTFQNMSNGDYWLQDASFKLVNIQDCGTIAPFNPNSASFEEDYVTPCPEANLTTSEWLSTPQIYIYEQRNVASSTPLYLLIKGNFVNTTGSINEQCYYKVALKNINGNLVDIIRNHHYIVKIKNVTSAGYSTEEEALANIPANSVDVSIENAYYNSVSNGGSLLTVEKTSAYYCAPNETISLTYKYIPNVYNGVVNNNDVIITVKNKDNGSIKQGSVKYDNGVITAVTSATMPELNESFETELIVSANGLKRTIKIYLSQPNTFENVWALPNVVGELAQGTPVDVNFTLPSNASVSYPSNVYVTTKLAPAPGSNLKRVSQNGQFKWCYTAIAPGRQTIKFATSQRNTPQHTLVLEADNFISKDLNIGSRATYAFTNVIVQRYGFNNVVVYYYNSQPRPSYNLTVVTNILKPTPGNTFQYKAFEDCSIFNITSNGMMRLDFELKSTSNETITLIADDTTPYSFKLPPA